MPDTRRKVIRGVKLRGESKVARIPVKVTPTTRPLRKPSWIRARAHAAPNVMRMKKLLRVMRLHTVCEEASCPNLGECFGHGTATFMVMGDICTRRCPFCDVAHGRPNPLDPDEPEHLASAVHAIGLRYVVITSVDRDDLRDGGAAHFAACIKAIRRLNPGTKIEILVPDFRGRMENALVILEAEQPDIFNHNLETIPRLYRKVRPGSSYSWSLDLIQQFKQQCPHIPTKSGLMLGLGERLDEVEQTMGDLRAHGCDMLTLGQYLQPSKYHLSVERYVTPAEFQRLAEIGTRMGFSQVASGPMVRSSYHADQQAAGVLEVTE